MEFASHPSGCSPCAMAPPRNGKPSSPRSPEVDATPECRRAVECAFNRLGSLSFECADLPPWMCSGRYARVAIQLSPSVCRPHAVEAGLSELMR
jgi:hypothetical protein